MNLMLESLRLRGSIHMNEEQIEKWKAMGGKFVAVLIRKGEDYTAHESTINHLRWAGFRVLTVTEELLEDNPELFGKIFAEKALKDFAQPAENTSTDGKG